MASLAKSRFKSLSLRSLRGGDKEKKHHESDRSGDDAASGIITCTPVFRRKGLKKRLMSWRTKDKPTTSPDSPKLEKIESGESIEIVRSAKRKPLVKSQTIDSFGDLDFKEDSDGDNEDHEENSSKKRGKYSMFRDMFSEESTEYESYFVGNSFRQDSAMDDEYPESLDSKYDSFDEKRGRHMTSTPYYKNYNGRSHLSRFGSKEEGGDETRSRSSADVNHEGGDGESPPVSRSKKMWNSFKTRARKFRSRSREKIKSKNKDEGNLSQSQPDISNHSDSPGTTPKDQVFDQLFDDAEKRHQQNGDGDVTQDEDRKASEEDSGIAVTDHDPSSKDKDTAFRTYPFFQLDIHLKEGHDLVIRDSCGTSDPYVKFKIGGKQLYKSRIIHKNLNPRWDERFSLPVEDPTKVISVKVFDYDRGLNDDPMGGAEIVPKSLELNKPQDLKLKLTEKTGKSKSEYMGYITLTVTMLPKSQEEKEQYFKRNQKSGEATKKLKTQIWSSVVTIVLVEGKDLLPMDDNGYSDPYVKFRLGNEKYKSKYKPKTLNPSWVEQFDLHMFDDQTSHLEISVWDHDTAGKDDIMGRAVIDLSTLAREETHALEQPLEDGAGIIKMMLSISGTCGAESVSDLTNYIPNPRERENIIRKYGLANSLKNLRDVGWLQVKVIKAQNLTSADIGGKSDPFCVLELVNDRLQTQTEYKTLNPEWGKVFTFNVKDIHSLLEVTVYDEDRDKKSEFLGKIAIPILRIQSGERRWFALKDKKLSLRAKGSIMLELDFVYNHIRKKDRRWYQLKDKKNLGRAKGAILLEMDFYFNHAKAAIRTFNPREEKYMQPEPKFKISIMKRNIDRVSKIADAAVESGKFIQSCFDWESKARSITAFIVFLIIVWNFELYMLPITLLIIFFKNLLVVHIVGNLMKEKDEDEYVDEEDDEDEEDKDKEEKKSFKEKLQAVQEVCLQVQEGMDMVASMGERVKNTANWTVPWLSWLAVTIFFIGTFVLFYVPVRFLILAWGINKFTKKLRAPNAIPNNELLDYLSRVPSDKELIMYRELRPDPGVGTTKKKRTST